jgi:hypothetical protein
MNSPGYITPVAAALAQTGQVERISPRDVRVPPTRRAASAAAVEPTDELVLSVETAEAVTEYRRHDEEHEDHKRQDRRRRRPQPKSETAKKDAAKKEEPAAELLRRRDTSAQRRVGPGGQLPAGYVHPTQPIRSTLDITG